MMADKKRLQELVDAYGRNPLRWPEKDRLRFAEVLRNPAILDGLDIEPADQLDKLLDLAGARALDEPQGAKARLMARLKDEVQDAHDVSHIDEIGLQASVFQLRNLMAAGVMAASIAVGVFVGLNNDAGMLLADSLQLQSFSGESDLDFVFSSDSADGDVL